MIIIANPWVSPNWTDKVLDAATKSVVGLVDQFSGAQNLDPQVDEVDVDHQDFEFLDKPRLRWSYPGEPHFECDLCHIDLLDLTEDRYDLLADDQHLGSLFKQPDGHYRFPPSIQLPLTEPQQVIYLCDARGESSYHQEIQLWNGEGLLVFRQFWQTSIIQFFEACLPEIFSTWVEGDHLP